MQKDLNENMKTMKINDVLQRNVYIFSRLDLTGEMLWNSNKELLRTYLCIHAVHPWLWKQRADI